MGVDSGAVIKTLNKTCLNSLQSAAGLCLSHTNYSVEIEHWLIKLAELHDTDLTRIFRHFEVNASHLQRDLTKAIDRLKTGNARTPTLSPSIDHWIRAAWESGDAWLKACAVHVSRHVPDLTPNAFAVQRDESPVVRAEVEARFRDHGPARLPAIEARTPA